MRIVVLSMLTLFVLYGALDLDAMNYRDSEIGTDKELLRSFIEVGEIYKFKAINVQFLPIATLEYLGRLAHARSKALALASQLDFGNETWYVGKTIITELQTAIAQEQQKNNHAKHKHGATDYANDYITKELNHPVNNNNRLKNADTAKVAALRLIQGAMPLGSSICTALVQVMNQTEAYAEKMYKESKSHYLTSEEHFGFGTSFMSGFQRNIGCTYIALETGKINGITTLLDMALEGSIVS